MLNWLFSRLYRLSFQRLMFRMSVGRLFLGCLLVLSRFTALSSCFPCLSLGHLMLLFLMPVIVHEIHFKSLNSLEVILRRSTLVYDRIVITDFLKWSVQMRIL